MEGDAAVSLLFGTAVRRGERGRSGVERSHRGILKLHPTSAAEPDPCECLPGQIRRSAHPVAQSCGLRSAGAWIVREPGLQRCRWTAYLVVRYGFIADL